MRARRNPTEAQLLRRLRRPPESCHDPRHKNDPYWALRQQGFSHAYAKRAYRDELPVVKTHVVHAPDDEYSCPEDEFLFAIGSTVSQTFVKVRPVLCAETVVSLQPRQKDYTVWDMGVVGFGLIVRPTGHKSYIFMYRIPPGRKSRKITIGSATKVSYETARSAAALFRRAISQNIDHADRCTDTASSLSELARYPLPKTDIGWMRRLGRLPQGLSG